MSENYITLSVSSKDLGKRIDIFLAEKIKELSRNQVIKLIHDKNIKYNNHSVSVQSTRVKEQGQIIIKIPSPVLIEILPQKIDLNIVYEDNSIVVINKPAGMVVHPGAGINKNTMVNALLYHCRNKLSSIGGKIRPGIVHRIDKMTSGLVVVAKNDISHQNLAKQFQNRIIDRKYEAFVWNNVVKNTGVIDTFIGRSSIDRKKMAVTSPKRGRKSITNYKLIKKFVINDNFICHCECFLKTGRTHQIRVHMKHIGNPLIGDNVYCKNKMLKKDIPEHVKKIINYYFTNTGRHALHAKTIGFIHPESNKKMSFSSKLPKDMKKLEDLLNSNKKSQL